MDVVARPVRLIVVPVSAQMQQVQLIDQSMFFEEVNRAVDRNKVHAGIYLLRALQNLVHVQVLLGVVHHLQNHAPLPVKRMRRFPKACCSLPVSPRY